MALNFNPWGYVIIIGCLIVMYLIYFKINSGLKRPTDVSHGSKGNEYLWEPQKPKFTQKKEGGKRKHKLRRKPRR